MMLRVAFWTSAVPYLTVVLFYQDGLRTAGQIFFEASMGALLGLIFASVFAKRASRKRIGFRYSELNALRSHASAQDQ